MKETTSRKETANEELKGSSGNGLLIDDLVLANENLRKVEMENELLLSLNNDIASIRDKDDLLHVIHNRLKNLFSVSDLFICIVDENKETIYPFLRVVAPHRASLPDYERIINSCFPINNGIFDKVLQSKEPVVFEIQHPGNSQNPSEYMKFLWDCGLAEAVSAS